MFGDETLLHEMILYNLTAISLKKNVIQGIYETTYPRFRPYNSLVQGASHVSREGRRAECLGLPQLNSPPKP